MICKYGIIPLREDYYVYQLGSAFESKLRILFDKSEIRTILKIHKLTRLEVYTPNATLAISVQSFEERLRYLYEKI